MRDIASGALKAYFEKEGCVLVAYLFGSRSRGNATADSDIDIAVLLAEPHRGSLELYLRLSDELSKRLGEVDLVILNEAPPLLKYQVIRHGKVIYCGDEGARIEFEARAQDEYLDFSRAAARYDECLLRSLMR
ncbi:MAG: nucleotidyltransferase domain-containing protein [Candidatus Bathyarchaeia archaeon]